MENSDDELILGGILDSSSESLSSSSSSSSTSSSDSSSSDERPFFHDRRLLYELKDMSPNRHLRLFGMSRETFREFYDEVWELLPPGRSVNGYSLIPEERLYYFLHLVCGDEFELQSAWANDIGEGTVCNNLNIVIDALNPVIGDESSFVRRNIYLPNEEKARQDARNFSDMSGFCERVWSLADGTHCDVR